MENTLTYTQKKEIATIAVRCSIASCDFNTKINCAIKRNKLYEDNDLIIEINSLITHFKDDLIDYLNLLDYRELELCAEMYTIDSLMYDMKTLDFVINDEKYNFVSLLTAFTERILKIRNSIFLTGCDEDSCKKILGKAISLLGVNKKYVR